MGNQDRRISRRSFMGGAAAVATAAGVAGGFPSSMADALAQPRKSGTLDDVDHVVILMQENRSFDHYYGTMRGVRGFSDHAALTLADGNSLFFQPDPSRTDGGYLLPFHVGTNRFDSQGLGDLLHDWNSTHNAWSRGVNDAWIASKGEMTMAYFEKDDIPFHRALAGAYTICDNYHCSVMGPTIPNRLYLWTGMIDPEGEHGGPATYNPPSYEAVYSWKTYPERLQKAGVTWQVYANDEQGNDFAGDYGDNPLWNFKAYHEALASKDAKIHDLAVRGGLVKTWKPYSGKGLIVNHVINKFRKACASGTLPAVSWVVAPYGYSEHPAARPVDGQAYVQGVLDAVWGNPDLRNSTVVLIDYDENDGFFDHLPPPVPPAGTPGEFLPDSQPFGPYPSAGSGLTPIGLGPRVPMTVVSPWSRGGWVNSQVFDHTSVLRFLELWTGVTEPNISAWRREVCGDLMSCFDFTSSNSTVPVLPNTASMRQRANEIDPHLPYPAPPKEGDQQPAVQEPGQAPARALPYQGLANFMTTKDALHLTVANTGAVAFPVALYSLDTRSRLTVRNLDVSPGGGSDASVPMDASTHAYNASVHGPNGFLAEAAGDEQSNDLGVEVSLTITGSTQHPTLLLSATNSGKSKITMRITTRDGATQVIQISGGGSRHRSYDPIVGADGWYDLSVTVDQAATYSRRFAGHLENGQPSLTG